MINWFDMPAEGLSNGGLFEVKELEVTENGTYETKGEMYNKVTVNVEGGGGSSDFSTAEVTIQSTEEWVESLYMPAIYDEEQDAYIYAIGSPDVGAHIVPLYKGHAQISYDGELNVSVSGSATYDGHETITVTGDCTITIS